MASLSTPPMAPRNRPAGRVRDPFDVQHLVCESAERQVLASVLDLLDRDLPVAREVVGGLSAEMFHGHMTAEVFDAVREVLSRQAKPSVADVWAALRRHGQDGDDAHHLVTELLRDRIGTGWHAARDARAGADDLRQSHEKRQSLLAIESYLRGGGRPSDATAVIRHLERARAASEAASGNKPITLLDAVDSWAKLERTPVVRTGMSWFDGPTEGGLPIGGIVALVAFPQVGKSALALQLTLGALVCDPELRAVWGLGEMTPQALARRSACVASTMLEGCEAVTMQGAGDRTSAARAANAALCNVIGDRLGIVPAPLTVDRLEDRVAATGAKLCVIDYLQLLREPNAQDRVQELEHIIGRIRDMAITRECSVIAISSMARSAGTSSRIGQLAKGSTEIDYAVELAYVGEAEERDGKPAYREDGSVNVTWHCKKSRNLESRDLLLQFDGATQTYSPQGFTEFSSFGQR